MNITLARQTPPLARCDLLVVLADPNYPDDVLRQLDRLARGHLLRTLRRRRFRPPQGEAILYPMPLPSRGPAHVLIVPTKEIDLAAWRRAADLAVRHGSDLRAKAIALAPADEEARETVAETLELAAYRFRGLKSKPGDQVAPVPTSAVLLHAAGPRAQAAVARGQLLGRATCRARDLVNLPADVVTPSRLAAEARRIARSQRLRARIFDERQIRRHGMGALLGVARGSVQPPRFIELVYRPRAPRKRIALVGKGITFDSGGLSLKGSESMQAQKRDMGGGAVVLGVMSVIRDLAPAVEVRGYIPSTENMPSGAAIKPGDVVRAYNGTTIEVLNTDAEGRLVLADGLSFAAAAKPDAIIDFATLTAAVRAALGSRYAAIMSTDKALAGNLIAAAAESAENLWELPLVPEYRRDIDSSVADIKNTGEGQAGTIIGGLFLREFVGTTSWAHIDFSSTVVTEKPFPGHPKGASGFGVRTVLRYLLRAGEA